MDEPTYNPACPLPSTTIVYQYKLVNCPGKTIISMLIEYPPNGSTPPHRHGGASVSGYVLHGSVLIKMNDEPMRVVEQGGSWYEAPGCHHRISDNTSPTKPASFLATFVADTDTLEREGPSVLLQYDEEYKELVKKKMEQYIYP